MTPFSLAVRLWVILLSLLFAQHLDAANLSKRHDPKGDLKVGLDWELVKDRRHIDGDPQNEKKHRWVFTSYLTFTESTTSITDGQLVQMGLDAYDEMVADINQYAPEKDHLKGGLKSLPNAMTIMAFDTQIILASSIKGHQGFLSTFPGDNPLKTAMETCQLRFDEKHSDTKKKDGHRTQASCGEISTFWRYYQLDSPNNPVKRIASLQPRARVTTIGLQGESGPMVVEPCGKNNIVSTEINRQRPIQADFY